MKSRTDRRINMKHRLSELGIESIRIEGINAGEYDTGNLVFGEQKKHLNNAEIGCFLTHHNLYKTILDEGHETALILEDDALFLEGYKEVVEQAMKDIPKDWDLLYLGQANYDSIKIAQSAELKTHAIKENIAGQLFKASRCWLTHAYVVNRKALPKLIEGTQVLYASIDGVLADLQENLNVYAIYPNIVKQDGTQSSIR